MRYELVSPASVAPDTYRLAYSFHQLWAYFGVALPLPFAVSNVVLLLSVSKSHLHHRTDSNLSISLQRIAIALNLLATLVFLSPVLPQVDREISLLGIPLTLLAVTGYAASYTAVWRLSPSRTLTPTFVALTMSLAATLTFGIPCALDALDVVFAQTPQEISTSFDILTKTGIHLILAPASLILLALLLLFPRIINPNIRQSTRRTALGLGRFLAFVLVAAGVAETVVRAELAPSLVESYWSVGTLHALLGGPSLALFTMWILLEHPAHRLGRWLLGASAIAFAVSCMADMLLGLQGMPQRYAEYEVVFESGHSLATIAWTSFLLLLVVTFAVLHRERHAKVQVDDFS